MKMQKVNLSTIAKVLPGFGFPKQYQGNKIGKYPFYKVGDISKTVQGGRKIMDGADNYISDETLNEIRAKVIPQNTVVFAKIGEALKLNRRAITSTESIIDNNVVGVFADSKKVLPLFLYYFFLKIDLSKLSRATTVPSVRKTDLEQISVPLIDLDAQQKIVDKIEELFSVIDQQCKQILLMSRQASTIRQSLLQAAVLGRLSPFSSVKKSTLNDLGSWSGGGTPSKSVPKFWKDGDIPWVSPKDMKSRFITDSQDKITQEAIDNSSAKLISAGSLLIVTRSGILRRTLPVAVAKVDVTVNQDIKALTPDENKILGDYLLILFEAFNQDIRFKCSKSGTTVESIEYPTLLRYVVEYPSIDEQKKVIQMVNEFESIIFAEERSLKDTEKISNRLKQSILKQAFEGKLA